MIGFLPISIVSAGMSLLRTGAGALSAFFGSSDKQFTSTYASTLTANPAMHRTRLNSYLKPVPTTRPKDQARPNPFLARREESFSVTPTLHPSSQEPLSNRPQTSL